MNEQSRQTRWDNSPLFDDLWPDIVALLFAVDRSDLLYLQHETGMNKGTLSSHLSQLEEAGYVEVSKTYRGKVPRTLLCLTGAGREAFELYRRKLKEAL